MLALASSRRGRSPLEGCRRQICAFLVPFLAAILLASCEKDPHDPETWVPKLNDVADWREAVRNLERLKEPGTIKPLSAAWKKRNRDSQILRTIIAIAGNPSEKGGKTHYDLALPVLLEAVERFDPTDGRSIDDAVVACEALGKARDSQAVPVLLGAAQKAVPRLSQANNVRIAAIRALGKFRDPKVVDALIKVLGANPKDQVLKLHAAAALALAETGDPKALPTLTQAMFIGAIFKQVRAGVTRIGKQATPAMIALFQEKDPAIQELAKTKNYEKVAPGIQIYNGALILGDLRAKEAVPALIAGLKAPPRVSFYDERSGAPGPSTHMAILEALQAIGDPGAGPAVWAYATDPRTDDFVRPRAIDVYSWLAQDGSALPHLLKNVRSDQEEEQIRFVSVIAYGRIARLAEDLKPIEELIKSYETKITAAEKKVKTAASPSDKEAASEEVDMATTWRNILTETRHRIEIAIQCKSDATCFGNTLSARDIAIGRPGLPKAERALLELYRMGEKGRPALDILLKSAESSERIVREGIHLALPRIAPIPCKPCAERLEEVMKKQESQTTLDALNYATRLVYNYFAWAGT
ncbi:MAG: HEAT repeat domain-containing protein [Deltaproteobacteria bacterium]|nr:HEAT repeat domain-containing protein [Deltaproteobacteria bacterium]